MEYTNLADLFAASPFAGADMDFKRDADEGREVTLKAENQDNTAQARLGGFEGIEFRDSPAGRQAYLSGSSLAVWEVMLIARSYAGDAAAVASHLGWEALKVKAAFDYAKANSAEISEALAAHDAAGLPELKGLLPGVGEFHAGAKS